MGTPVLPGKQLSSGLKERLKRCGRYYKSPVVPKRLCSDPASPSVGASLKSDPVPFPEADMTAACDTNHSLVEKSPKVETKLVQQTVETPKRVRSGQVKTFRRSPRASPASSSVELSAKKSPMLKNEKAVPSSPSSDLDLQCTPKRPKLSQTSSSSSQMQDSDSDLASSSKCSGSSSISSKETLPLTRSPKVSEMSSSSGCSTSCKESPLVTSGAKDNTNSGTVEELLEHRNNILNRLKKKEEQLRKLKMVKLYREKNDLQNLEALTTKWREVSQEAVQHLWDLAPDPKPTLTQVVDHFQLDHTFLHYDPEEESFLNQ